MTDLYALRDLPEHVRHVVETKFFKPIDDQAAIMLSMIEDRKRKWEWTRQTRSAWSRFLIAQILRHPDEIDALHKKWDFVFTQPDAETAAQYKVVRGPSDPVTFEDYLANVPLNQKDVRTFEAYMIALDNEKIGTIINNMNWNVFFAENARYEFMTSDRPVIKTFLNHDNAHIALPIGPHALFVAAKDERVLAEIQRVAQNDLVKTVNMRVVQQARRFVYATNEAQRSFVQKYFGADEMQTHLAPLPT